jgi:hypothetical protein
VAVTVPALLLERVAEKACAGTWRNTQDSLKHIKLAILEPQRRPLAGHGAYPNGS